MRLISRAHYAPVGPDWRIVDWLDRHIAAVLIAPAVVVLIGVSLYPFLFNVYLSAHSVSLITIRAEDWRFTGLSNFISILGDPSTREALVRTAIFTIASVALQLSLGLAGALAFNTAFRGKAVLMVLALIPMMVTPVVVGIAWRMLLNYDWGLANYFLAVIGFSPVEWLSSPRVAFVSMVLVQVWWGMSFAMLVILGGLTAIPPSLYQAAEVDGARDWQMFTNITLPMLKPVLLVVGTIKIIDALREFDLIYTLTGGGPGNATRVFALELYYTAYERGNFGMSAAQALLLMALVVVLTVPLVRLLMNREGA